MPEILSIDQDNHQAELRGADFFFFDPDALPPTQIVTVAPNDDINDSGAVRPDVLQWSDSRILVDQTVVEAMASDTYWFVTDRNGMSNLDGFYIPASGAQYCEPETMNLFTFSQLAGQVRTLVPGVDQNEAELAVEVEMRSLFQEHTWSFARKNLVLTTIKAKTEGTIAVVEGGLLVTGTGTAFTTDDVGKFLRAPDGHFYEIAAVNVHAQTLRLCTAPFTGVTGSGHTYTIFQHRFSLPPGIERILTMSNSLAGVRQRAQFDVDAHDPRRMVIGEPINFIPLGTDMRTGLHVIELWPVPLRAFHLPYVGLKQREAGGADDILSDISTLLLDTACERACLIAFGSSQGKAPYWLQLASVYHKNVYGDSSSLNRGRLLNIKKMDRKRFGYSEREPGSFGYYYRNDPGVDVGMDSFYEW